MKYGIIRDTQEAKRKNVVFFVHFNKNNKLEKRTILTLLTLREIFQEIVVIANSRLSNRNKQKVEELSDRLIMRENKGYDFGAWRDAMDLYGWDNLEICDSVTLMNDTTYFPIFPFRKIFMQFQDNELIDFWGASIHGETKTGMPGTPGRKGPVPEHVQSYYMTFKKRVVQSSEYRMFWENVKDYASVEEVIQKYETQLTGILAEAGFTYDAILNPNHCNSRTGALIDALYQVPEELIAYGFPFLKIKVVSRANRNDLRLQLKKSRSNYPANYVTAYRPSRNSCYRFTSWFLSKRR